MWRTFVLRLANQGHGAIVPTSRAGLAASADLLAHDWAFVAVPSSLPTIHPETA